MMPSCQCAVVFIGSRVAWDGEGVFIIGFHRLGGLGEGVVDIADIVVGLCREVGRQLFRLGRQIARVESFDASLSSQSIFSLFLAWNAVQVSLAMMATPGITSTGLPVPSTAKASITPGIALISASLKELTLPPAAGHLV